MPGRTTKGKPRSHARGTPPVIGQVQQRLLRIYDRVLDGRIWEIHPEDHDMKPRRFFLTVRQHVNTNHISAMVVKREHLVYVQNLERKSTRDLDVYTLTNQRPVRRRWLPDNQPEDDGTDPDPSETAEPEDEQELPAAITQSPPKRRRVVVSKTNVSNVDLEPFVLACMNEYFESSLTVGEVRRVVESKVLQTDERRLVDDQQVRLCLMRLAEDPDTLVFRREAYRTETVMMKLNGKKTYLYSPTNPVPTWNAGLHDILWERYPPVRTKLNQPIPPAPKAIAAAWSPAPEPPIVVPEKVATPLIPEESEHNLIRPAPEPPKRIINEQPTYRVTGEPSTARHLSSADLAIEIIRELEFAAMQGEEKEELARLRVESGELREEVARLRGENLELTREQARLQTARDSAVDQLRSIAEAQRTIAAVLGLGQE